MTKYQLLGVRNLNLSAFQAQHSMAIHTAFSINPFFCMCLTIQNPQFSASFDDLEVDFLVLDLDVQHRFDVNTQFHQEADERIHKLLPLLAFCF